MFAELMQDQKDHRIAKIFNKYYTRSRVEIHKHRTKFRTRLMRRRILNKREFEK